jgi:hypothetical protein
MSETPKLTAAQRWALVRGADIPRHLRHLLLILQHYGGENGAIWCSRGALAEELGVCEAVVSQNMKKLESLGVIKRFWTGRNNQTTRECSIQFEMLKTCQRSVRNSSGCSVSESSQCNETSVSESSQSPLENPQGQCEGILRHKQPLNNQGTTMRGRTHKSAFQKPTVEQVAAYVRAYCHEKNLPAIEPEDFIDHFESNGWKVGGKSPMKNWQACLRKWIRNQQRWREEQNSRKPVSPAVDGIPEAKQAWQKILNAAKEHHGNAAGFESEIGPELTEIVRALGLTRQKIDQASTFDRREQEREFIQAFDRQGEAA